MLRSNLKEVPAYLRYVRRLIAKLWSKHDELREGGRNYIVEAAYGLPISMSRMSIIRCGL